MKPPVLNQRRRKLMAFLLIPFLLVLTGCLKFDLDVEIESEDDATMALEVIDTMGMLEIAENGCDTFTDDLHDASVEEITDSEGNAGCRVSGKMDSSQNTDGFSVTKEGDELFFQMGNIAADFDDNDEIDLDDPMLEMFSPDVSISVSFPGKVTHASSGGEVDGNTVTWTGMESLFTKLEARGEASGGLFGGGGGSDDADEEEDPAAGAEDEDVAEPEADPEDDEGAVADDEEATTSAESDTSSERDAGSDFPIWVVVLLGLLLLLVVFLIVMVARRKPKDPQEGDYPQHQQQFAGPYPGHYPQHGQYPQQGQYPGQQWDQTQQMPQQGGQWDQTQQWDHNQWNQGNDGGQPPQQ